MVIYNHLKAMKLLENPHYDSLTPHLLSERDFQIKIFSNFIYSGKTRSFSLRKEAKLVKIHGLVCRTSKL
jgi:hypothetical protein